MKIGIASDHRGFSLKQEVTKYLEDKGYYIVDYGTNNANMADYPDYGFKLGEAIYNEEITFGIAICATGTGIAIACNKVKNTRCVQVNNKDEAKMARLHNDANVIALSGNYSLKKAKGLVDIFLSTPFSNVERYIRRIEKLNNYELKEKKNGD